MSDTPTNPPEEGPRQRFRRLLSSENAVPDSGSEHKPDSESTPPASAPSLKPAAPDESPLPKVQSPATGQPWNRPSQSSTPPSTVPFSAETGESEEQTPPTHTYVPPPPPLGNTPPSGSRPALSADGMPLPRRVDEIDMDATRVSPAAVPETRRVRHIPANPPAVVNPVPVSQPRSDLWLAFQRGFGCLMKVAIVVVFLMVIVLLVLGTIAVREYYLVSATIPSIDDLQQKASQFETTRILDRNGGVLYEILDPTAGRRTYVSLDKISPYLVAATIATEDKNYYTHPGFDPLAIIRAFWQNYQSGGETVSGASTITQQLAKRLLFTPQEQVEQTYRRKVREALAAAEITRRYSKDEILELYLNEIYYGNLSYGVEAAAETYFNTTADKLTLAQASFLAGLPQSPGVYDIYNNRDATLKRLQQVLTLMYEVSLEQNCIRVSNNPTPICVDRQSALSAYDDIVKYEFHTPEVQMQDPHWVNYVRSQLEAQYDAQTIYRSGFSVYTTIDPDLQAQAEQIVRDQVAKLKDNNATDGALVAIQPSTGEILAMVGSADFYNDAIHGQVNMATSPTRQPGSSIKPLTYLAAFEKGWTASTLIWDVPSEFPPSGDPSDNRPPYIPVNYDGQFHGPVTVRFALANSYNIPAVKTLQFVGVYGDKSQNGQGGLVGMAKRLGITSLTRSDYGLALTLGGGEVSLLELTGAYAVIANAGIQQPLVSITKILDHTGKVVYEYKPGSGNAVVRAEHAYLISSILSDNAARTPAFGPNSVLNLPFPAAVKTGTSNDFRDNWTLGYTPDLTVGVWVGNADYTPMVNTSGITGAAPIWSQFMQYAINKLDGNNPKPFVKPAGIVERIVCAASGTEPSQWCPDQRREYFVADQLPLPKEQDLWVNVNFDTWTNLRASEVCGNYRKQQLAINVTDPWAISWITNNNHGKAWAQQMGFNEPFAFAPSRDCKAEDPRVTISLNVSDGQIINTDTLSLMGQVDATANFKSFTIDYGLGDQPSEWKQLTSSDQPVKQPGAVFTWNLRDTFPQGIPTGGVGLRITMQSIQGTSAEKIFHLNFQVPTLTPTPTSTVTLTPTPTVTATPQPSDTPTSTITTAPTITDTPVPVPSSEASATPTP